MICLWNRLIVNFTVGIALAHSAATVHACDPGWLPGDSVPGLQGSVEAMISWDPDGAGPATSVLVAGGQNIVYSDTGPASNIVAYDGQQWASLGAGVSGGGVIAMAIFNNELIAAGTFTSAGGQPANRIARWDGAAWHLLGSGLNGHVSALAVYSNQLYAAGAFNTAGGGSAAKIARWNGSAWSPVGTGLTGSPLTMAVANGSLFVGGLLTNAGSITVSNLAQWNGTTWLNPANVNDMVTSLSVNSPGCFGCSSTIILGGYFTQINSTSALHVAGLDSGGFPFALGSGLSDPCRTVMVRRTGGASPLAYEVIATTEDFPIVPQQVWRYTPSSGAWNSLGGFDHGFAKPLVYFNGKHYVGVYDSDGQTAPCVQSWSGQDWIPVGKGIAGQVKAICITGDDVIAAGEFEFASDARVNNIARRDAVTEDWSALGSGINGSVHALLTLPSGEVIAAGEFASASGALANNIAQWNGTSWSSLGTGLNDPAIALSLLSNGDVIVGGDFTTAGGGTANRIARWNGSTWSAIGNGFSDGTVYSLVERSNGDIIAGGYDLSTPGLGGFNNAVVARWNGASWSPILQTSGFGSALAALPNGDIIVGGYLSPGSNFNNLRSWNGSMWTNLGEFDGGVHALTLLPNGDVAAAGSFTTINMLPASRIASWNGLTWSALATGLTDVSPGTTAYALAVLPNGELAVGGNFTFAGGGMSARFARWDCDLPCVTAADCKSDSTGSNADNACNCASCNNGSCEFTCARFGNANCDGMQTVNLSDILCVLNGFAVFSNCPNSDLAPCGGNGLVNLEDILGVLNAFGGANPCGCNPNGASPVCGSTSP